MAEERRNNGPPGVIRADELYTLDEFRARLRIGGHAWRSLRNQGLPVHRVCNRALIRGGDFLSWLAEREG